MHTGARHLLTSAARRSTAATAAKSTGARFFSASAGRRADFTHAVIGGGVVGLAAARVLAERIANQSASSASAGSSVLLLERHDAVGTETSSRNSEVIHAGLYYGLDTLKTKLCIEGRQQLYKFCDQYGVGHRNTGKWIVAQTPGQREAVEKVFAFGEAYRGRDGDQSSVLPLRWVSPDEAQRREPAVRAVTGILESPSSGIVDSHGLMQTLLGLFEQAGGVLAAGSPVVKITPLGSSRDGSGGWQLHVRAADAKDGEGETIVTADTIVNAAGLGSADVHNMITQAHPPSSGGAAAAAAEAPAPIRLYYAKGNYFSYSASQPHVSTLVYPAPEPGLGGLGTHLTLDLSGRIRFGPDIEWVDDPTNLAVSAAQLPQAIGMIKSYLPSVDTAALQPDYAGIRPKLQPAGSVFAGKTFSDFIIRNEPGYQGWVNLLGIESPGLTASLAIGERVDKLFYSSQAV